METIEISTNTSTTLSLNFINILVTLILIVSFISCENKLEPPQTDLNSEEIPNQESWNSTVVFSDSGHVKAILRAGHIAVFNTKGYTLVDSNAVVDFYNKNGQKVSTLHGKRGKVLDRTKDIEIYDSVVAVNQEGSVLRTEKLLWNNKSQKVYTVISLD